MRSLTDMIAHKRRQAEKSQAWADKLQSQLDETREREERESMGSGMEDEEDEEEELAEARSRREEAEKQWQEVLSRKLFRATAKSKSRRSEPYLGLAGFDEL